MNHSPAPIKSANRGRMPPRSPLPPSVDVSFRMPKELALAIRELAKANRRGIGEQTNMLIEAALQAREGKAEKQAAAA